MRLLYENLVKSVVNDPARCKVSHRHMEVMCHIHTSCNQVWDVDTLAALSRNDTSIGAAPLFDFSTDPLTQFQSLRIKQDHNGQRLCSILPW